MEYELTIKVQVSPEVFSDLFITALESGISFAWVEEINSDKPLTEKETWEKLDKEGFYMLVTYDEGEAKRVHITSEQLCEALAETVTLQNLHFDDDGLLHDHDALDADVFVQMLVFKEHIYG